MTVIGKVSRDEWRSLALIAGTILGTIAGYVFGLTDAGAWIALAVGAISLERIAAFLTRRDLRTQLRRPTLGVAMIVVVIAGVIYTVGLGAIDRPGFTATEAAWFLSCMTAARAIAVRATLRKHPEIRASFDVQAPPGPTRP